MDLVNYFRRLYDIENVGAITWGHEVNRQAALTRYLEDDEMMFLEADVNESPDGTPVMVHPPETPSEIVVDGTPISTSRPQVYDVTCQEFLNQITPTTKGIKLDFKSERVVPACLKMLKALNPEQPVILNGDILRGNGTDEPRLGHNFIKVCQELYPTATLSLGWRTNANFSYTPANIDAMLNLLQEFELDHVIIPVRACLARDAWQQLQRLTAGPTKIIFYFWNNELVAPELLAWIRTRSDPATTMYDLMDINKRPIQVFAGERVKVGAHELRSL
jgi:glycerophosphoryl diester phosphodiesterase